MENDIPQYKPGLLEKLAIPLAIVIAGAFIAGALYYSNTHSQSSVQTVLAQNTQTAAAQIPPVSADDHILGNPNANIVIVEYSDTECPYCKQFHSTLNRLMDEYGKGGKVAWVYRNFPIESLHSKAPKEAEALECANLLGGPEKFWKYTNMIYDVTTSNDSLDPAQLPKIAKTVGLDVTAFNDCLSSGKFKNKVKAQYDEAIKAGGRGTPTSFLLLKDGSQTMLPGALPYQNMKATIDAILQG